MMVVKCTGQISLEVNKVAADMLENFLFDFSTHSVPTTPTRWHDTVARILRREIYRNFFLMPRLLMPHYSANHKLRLYARRPFLTLLTSALPFVMFGQTRKKRQSSPGKSTKVCSPADTQTVPLQIHASI